MGGWVGGWVWMGADGWGWAGVGGLWPVYFGVLHLKLEGRTRAENLKLGGESWAQPWSMAGGGAGGLLSCHFFFPADWPMLLCSHQAWPKTLNIVWHFAEPPSDERLSCAAQKPKLPKL